GTDVEQLDTARMLANIDGHISLAERNAAVYKDAMEVDGRNTHAQELYDTRQKGWEFGKSIASGVVEEATNKVPGGAIVQSIVGDMADKGMDKAIEAWNPEPTPDRVQFPAPDSAQRIAIREFDTTIREANAANPNPLPHKVVEDYRDHYGGAYNDLVPHLLIADANDLQKFLNGGVGAPTTKEGK
ncbi:hypothetical protein ACW9HQ_40360, partial [Nocardia gipuzkoensis]